MGKAVHEEQPRHQARQGKERIWQAVRRHAGKAPEDDAEDRHREERLDQRPAGAQHRLLVADFDVAPDEEEDQLAELPQLAEPQARPPQRRLDDGDGRLGGRSRGLRVRSYVLTQTWGNMGDRARHVVLICLETSVRTFLCARGAVRPARFAFQFQFRNRLHAARAAAKSGHSRSRADIMPTGSGQRMFSVRSFHRMPRAESAR